MKVYKILFGLLITLGILVVALFFTTPPEHVAGIQHPDFSTMRKSGTSIHSSSTVAFISYFICLGFIAILMQFLIVGLVKNGLIQSKILKWMLISIVAIVIVYTLMFFADSTYVKEGHNKFFAGWPIPTAWMIYGMWGVPIVFSIIYFLGYRKFILTTEDEKRFLELVNKRESR